MEDDNLIISNRLKINKLWELLVCTPKSVLRVSGLKLPLNLLLSGLHNLKKNWMPALLSLLLFVGDKKMYIKILKFTFTKHTIEKQGDHRELSSVQSSNENRR